MIIESSANIIRADIARMLIAYKVDPQDRIGLTCDMIECIALRMRERSDVDVFNLAVFVQRALDQFLFAHGSYPETVEALGSVALAAKLGTADLYKSFSRMPACVGKRYRKNG